jgi:hypothetical protein
VKDVLDTRAMNGQAPDISYTVAIAAAGLLSYKARVTNDFEISMMLLMPPKIACLDLRRLRLGIRVLFWAWIWD